MNEWIIALLIYAWISARIGGYIYAIVSLDPSFQAVPKPVKWATIVAMEFCWPILLPFIIWNQRRRARIDQEYTEQARKDAATIVPDVDGIHTPVGSGDGKRVH